MSTPRSDEKAAASNHVVTIRELQDNIDVVESKQEQVEAALEGCGYYLGTNDHVSANAWCNSPNSSELVQTQNPPPTPTRVEPDADDHRRSRCSAVCSINNRC